MSYTVELTSEKESAERVVKVDLEKYGVLVKKCIDDLTSHEPYGEREATVKQTLLQEYATTLQTAQSESESTPPPPPPQSSSPSPQKVYYQTPTTSPTYLSPFTFKQLSHDTTRPLPSSITGQIQFIETITLTPGHQYNFLKHLPTWSSVQLIEMNVNRYISDSTKKYFKKEIMKRKGKRRAKENKERSVEDSPMGSSFIDRSDPFFSHSPSTEMGTFNPS